jgi:DNA polymerase III sliding clamp (beta) subunit (PCNA family)
MDSKTAVLLQSEHDITSFASKDPTRYILNGVHFNAEKERLEATDGKILIHIPVNKLPVDNLPAPLNQESESKSVVIPKDKFQKAIRNIVKKTKLEVLKNARLDSSKKERVTLTTTDLDCEQVVSTRPIEGEFPQIEQVFPAGDPKMTIIIAPGLLQKIATYACMYGKKNTGIKFEFRGNFDQIVFHITTKNDHKAVGVVMPIRLK